MTCRPVARALACILSILIPVAGRAQSAGAVRKLWTPYEFRQQPPISRANSSRLEALLRAGNLYLSLQDAIALALENNLDVAIERYAPLLADADLLRSQAGGGTIPSLDPTLSYNLNRAHQTSPQTSSFISGTSALVMSTTQSNVSLSKGFLTGTNAALTWNNNFALSNSVTNNFNPSVSSTMDLRITQHLLQGFGLAVNRRNIRIAQNGRKVSDLAFKTQVIATVASVMNMYWDLVSFNEDVKVKTQAVALAQKLLDDNKSQVEIGSLAPIEVVRAQAQLAGSRQDLVLSRTRVLQQETILKNALSRTGVTSPSVIDARIVPTDVARVPESDPIEPIQDLLSKALANRPELTQTELQVQNSRIALEGTRSAMKPTLDAVGDFQNSGLAGQTNSLVASSPLAGFIGGVNPYFVGGYGTALGQVARRNFPNYSVGFQFNVPLRNRAAQADMASTQLQLRQSELRQQQQINQIGVDVANALIAVQQAHAAYDAAVESRVLQDETLSAEQEKYRLGASTNFLVIQTQRDLAAAQSAEVAAKSNYVKAKVTLDQATGRLLEVNNVRIDEALSGQVSRPSSPPPEQ